MDYTYLIDNKTLDENKIIKYGFRLDNNVYVLEKELIENFYCEIKISKNVLVNVFDRELNEEYIPFNIKDNLGGFVLELREQVECILDDIIDKCFYDDSMVEKVLDYVYKKYKTERKNPFDDIESVVLYTTKRNKWYGLIMNIPFKSLGVKKEEKVWIMNVKATSDDIQKLIDYKFYFPAYHMNKKYWLTIILNKYSDFEEIKYLLDTSYFLVEN